MAALLLAATTASQATTTGPADVKLAKLARDASKAANPLIRMQASQRLVKAGERGLDACLGLVRQDGHAALSVELVRALGEFPMPAARQLLIGLVDDAGFTWRPQALQALVTKATPAEAAIFDRYLEHRSWLLRRWALLGAVKTRPGQTTELLAKGLEDPDPRVRVAAAAQAAMAGSKAPAPVVAVLLAGLDLEDDFFGEDIGYPTRREAMQAFAGTLTRNDGYDPGDARATRRSAIAKLAARVGVEPPPLGATLPAFALGFEIRSCRDGDRAVRIATDGSVWRGLFQPRRVEAKPELVERIRKLARAVPDDGKRLYGRIGCDVTRLCGLGADGTRHVRCAAGVEPEAFRALLAAWMLLEAATR